MKFNLLILVTVLVSLANGLSLQDLHGNNNISSRIAGYGEEIDIQQAPYQVSVRKNQKHICGGSILSANSILTSAECVWNVPTDQLSIRAGFTNLDDDDTHGQVVNVLFKYIHGSFIPHELSDYNVAVLYIQSITTVTVTMELPSVNTQLDENLVLVSTGWGAPIRGGEMTNHLMGVNIVKLPVLTCAIAYGQRILNFHFCAGYPETGITSCDGDYGGPLVIAGTDVLVGVSSYGYDCGLANYPTLYLDISHPEILNFITSVLV